jgi:hypothetical protein
MAAMPLAAAEPSAPTAAAIIEAAQLTEPATPSAPAEQRPARRAAGSPARSCRVRMRTGEAFQTFGQVTHVLQDKTGTLTQAGTPSPGCTRCPGWRPASSSRRRPTGG